MADDQLFPPVDWAFPQGQRRRWKQTGIEFEIICPSPDTIGSMVIAYDGSEFTTPFLNTMLVHYSEPVPDSTFTYVVEITLCSKTQLGTRSLDQLRGHADSFARNQNAMGLQTKAVSIEEVD